MKPEAEHDEPLNQHSPEVLEKLRKLLMVKQESEHAGEAEQALAAAQRIAVKYRIDLAKVKVVHIDPISKEPFTAREFVYGSRLYEPMDAKYIIWLLQQHFGVAVTYMVKTKRDEDGQAVKSEKSFRHMYQKERVVELLGRHSDTEFAAYAFEYLRTIFPKLWRKHKARTGCNMESRRSFYRGVYEGIHTALVRARDSAEKEEFLKLAADERKDIENRYALALVTSKKELKQELNERHPLLGTKRFKPDNIYDPASRNAGFQHGTRVKINRPLASTEKSALPRKRRAATEEKKCRCIKGIGLMGAELGIVKDCPIHGEKSGYLSFT